MLPSIFFLSHYVNVRDHTAESFSFCTKVLITIHLILNSFQRGMATTVKIRRPGHGRAVSWLNFKICCAFRKSVYWVTPPCPKIATIHVDARRANCTLSLAFQREIVKIYQKRNPEAAKMKRILTWELYHVIMRGDKLTDACSLPFGKSSTAVEHFSVVAYPHLNARPSRGLASTFEYFSNPLPSKHGV